MKYSSYKLTRNGNGPFVSDDPYVDFEKVKGLYYVNGKEGFRYVYMVVYPFSLILQPSPARHLLHLRHD